MSAEDAPEVRPGDASPGPHRPHTPRAALLLLGVSLLLALGVHLLGGQGGFGVRVLRDLHQALFVLAWVLPAYLLISRQGRDPLEVHALLGRPRGLGLAVGVSLGLLAAYVVAFAVLGDAPRPVAWGDVARLLVSHLAFVALPEEYFFRGVLQPSLDPPGGPRRRVLGAPLGRGALASAAVFAACHALFDLNPARLIVFFPGLWFAWLRARTGSLLPGIVAHAAANAVELACVGAWGEPPY